MPVAPMPRAVVCSTGIREKVCPSLGTIADRAATTSFVWSRMGVVTADASTWMKPSHTA